MDEFENYLCYLYGRYPHGFGKVEKAFWRLQIEGWMREHRCALIFAQRWCDDEAIDWCDNCILEKIKKYHPNIIYGK